MAETFKEHRDGLFGDNPPITPASHPDDPENVKARKDAAADADAAAAPKRSPVASVKQPEPSK